MTGFIFDLSAKYVILARGCTKTYNIIPVLANGIRWIIEHLLHEFINFVGYYVEVGSVTELMTFHDLNK